MTASARAATSAPSDGPRMLTVPELDATFPDLAGRCLFVDFDETLWLHNSTEAFLGFARPARMARLLLALLRLTRPLWRLQGRVDTGHRQDWLRVRIVTALMPWTLRAWRRAAPALGERHRNAPLIAMIARARPARIVIVSNGFRDILLPLLEGMGVAVDAVVAAPLRDGARWRMRGKIANIEAGPDAVHLDRACFVTDHPDDADLLLRVRDGLLCAWPDARYIRAHF